MLMPRMTLSKSSKPPSPGQPRDYGEFGPIMMYIAALPLLLVLFKDSVSGMLGAVFQLGLFALGLWCIWSGQRAQMAYDAADLARRPKLPLKLIGSLLIGTLVAILAAMQFHNILAPLGLCLTAVSLSIIAFGLDPMSDKGFENPDYVARQKADVMTRQASMELEEIVADVSELDDDDLVRQTEALRTAVERLLRTAAQDPSHLRQLRTPLRRMLDILTAEVDRLTNDWKSERRAFARLRYLAKMTTLARAFEGKARVVGLNEGRDVFDLEADLLLDRMQHDTAA